MLPYEHIRRIHFELSSICNAACPNCPRNIHGGRAIPNLKERAITFDEFTTMIDVDTLAQLEQIRFCGNYGDPVSARDLPQIVEWVYKYNPDIHIEINTNGGARNTEWWRRLGKLMKGHTGFVIFSVDGLADTNHIYRRGVVWQKLYENIQAYIGGGGRAVWEFLVFQHNEHQIEQARELSRQLDFNDFRVKKPFGFNDSYNSTPYMTVLDREGNFERALWPRGVEPVDVEPHDMDLDAYRLELTRAHKAAFGDREEQEMYFDYMDQSRPTGIDCMSIRDREIYVDSQGYMYPCCFLGHGGQVQRGRETVFFRRWVTENVGWDNISLFNKTVQEIAQSEYFELIEKTWDKTHREGKMAMCSLMCSSDCARNTMRNLYD